MEGEYVLVPAAAAELKVSRFTVWKWINSERLPAKRYGRDWIIDRKDLDHFKANRPKRGRPRRPPA